MAGGFKDTKEYRETEELIRSIVETGEVPERYPDYFYTEGGQPYYELRLYFCKNCSWSLISGELVRLLKDEVIKDGRCLEICAGQGMLSASLQKAGVDITATDSRSWMDADEMDIRTFCEVIHKKGVPAIRNYSEQWKGIDFVVVSWPEHNNSSIEDCLETMREYSPDCRMIYLGELKGGRNATDHFFHMAVECDEYKETLEKINAAYPRWPGLHDAVRIFR